MGVGDGTKLLGQFLSGSKKYYAVAELGSETDSMDSSGSITESIDCSHISHEMLLQAIPEFKGNIKQIPPMYSALKRDGKKLYELAREGIEVEREPREVNVYNLELVEPKHFPYFALNIECGGGFYVRSLISDIARKCGGRAHMTALVRTKQAQFEVSDCIPSMNWTYENIVEGIRTCSHKVGIDINSLPPAFSPTLS